MEYKATPSQQEALISNKGVYGEILEHHIDQDNGYLHIKVPSLLPQHYDYAWLVITRRGHCWLEFHHKDGELIRTYHHGKLMGE